MPRLAQSRQNERFCSFDEGTCLAAEQSEHLLSETGKINVYDVLPYPESHIQK